MNQGESIATPPQYAHALDLVRYATAKVIWVTSPFAFAQLIAIDIHRLGLNLRNSRKLTCCLFD